MTGRREETFGEAFDRLERETRALARRNWALRVWSVFMLLRLRRARTYMQRQRDDALRKRGLIP